MSKEYDRAAKQARSILESSFDHFNEITHNSAEHLRRSADEFERICKDAEQQMRGLLDAWEKQQTDKGKT